MSDFSGLNTALSSLQAQRRGLELAAQNVANANTDGYSRQRLDLESIGGSPVPAIFSIFTGQNGGVRVADVQRFRDQFMEIQAALEHGAMANLDVGSSTMKAIEQLFPEPGDTGLSSQLAAFWAGFDDVANHPDDPASRTQLIERGKTIATSLNTLSDQLDQQRQNMISELGATVNEINATADQITGLNQSIKAAQISGLDVNELMDKRDLLANKLAELTGGSIRNLDYGQVQVTVAGTPIVGAATTAQHLTLNTSASPITVRWQTTNTVAGITSGKAGGELTAINSTIPAYKTRLDQVATTLRDTVNQVIAPISGTLAPAQQDQSLSGNLTFKMAVNGGAYQTVTVAGADWSGAGGAAALQTALQNAIDTAIGGGRAAVTILGGNGADMTISVANVGTNVVTVQANGSDTAFTTLFGNTPVGLDGVGGRQFFTGTDASTIAVSSSIDGQPNAVAAGLLGLGPLDGSVALDLADLGQSTTGADAVYKQMVVQLGVDTQTAQSRADIQQKATDSLDSSRESYSGVNTDEEMMHMVEFQHAYEAAARFMTAIDSMLDTLINHTGVS
jgi:flagellar hook-associated protein 1 FlgK